MHKEEDSTEAIAGCSCLLSAIAVHGAGFCALPARARACISASIRVNLSIKGDKVQSDYQKHAPQYYE